jgi:5-carboxyvanillate decarboxylase
MALELGPGKGFLRIATEEAFASSNLFKLWKQGLDDGSINDPGFDSLWGHYLFSESPRAVAIREKIQDLNDIRLADMDATGIDIQVLSLTSPGVQMFDADLANAVARESNDELAAAVARHPDRYVGIAAAAPQDPAEAARELDRAVNQLGLRGMILNSHTNGEYFSDEKFWDIFEACESLDVPIYLHPNTPPASMIEPFKEAGLDGAVFGFGVETGLHLLRIITSGAFDRFPKLQVIVGHGGEALPFWMFRIDYMHTAMVKAGRHPQIRPLNKKPSEYLKSNVYITTSGMAWEPVVMFIRDVVGRDRVMYSMDYPYQFVAEEVEMYDRLPISAEELKQFYQTNAEQAFGFTAAD